MVPALPFRSRLRNVASATAAPAALHLIASRTDGPAPVVLLRADLSDLAPAAAFRHAVQVLDGLMRKWDGAALDVQVVDGDNTPLFIIGGAS